MLCVYSNRERDVGRHRREEIPDLEGRLHIPVTISVRRCEVAFVVIVISSARAGEF